MKKSIVYLILFSILFCGCEETSLDTFTPPETSYDITVMEFLKDPGQILFFNENVDTNDYELFVQALERTNLDISDIIGKNNTVFAPGSVAMQRILDSDDNWNSIEDIPRETLRVIMELHILPGLITRYDLTETPEEYTTINGQTITIFRTVVGDNGRGANIRVEDALVQSGDLRFLDGMVHTYGIAGTRANNNESKPIGL